MAVVIYHNPRCSKSRQTLELLREREIEPEIIDYLNNPPDSAELKKLLGLLQLTPRELMRRSEALYKEHHLADPALTDEQLVAAMVAHPKLIERPIVVVDGEAAALGRPPEQVLQVLPR